MGKMELEVKILNIDEKEMCEKIEALGGILVQNLSQQLYTYDMPTIYARYIDILIQINNSENKIKYEVAISKIKSLFFEIDNLLNEDEKYELKNIIGYKYLCDIINLNNFINILNIDNLINFIKRFQINPKKWIRLRKTGDKVTLAVKHVLADNDSSLQQMLETEIEVSSFEDANDLLEQLGFVFKSYQEKKRITYNLNEHEIEIDTWPEIPTYIEIEGQSEEDLEAILKVLGYSMKDTVSCTADDIYRMNNKSMFNNRELKF